LAKKRGNYLVPVKAILFDWGDTLIQMVQFDYDACLSKLHESLLHDGIALPFQEFKRLYFQTRDRLYKETEESLEEPNFLLRILETLKHFGYALEETDERIVGAADAFAEAFADQTTMKDLVPAVLEQLRHKYKLGVISNFALPPGVEKTLERFDLAKFFDVILISGEVGWRKPSPRIFQKALESLKVGASESVFVGDSPVSDVEGAKRIGMKTVLVRKSLTDEKETGNPDALINELDELPAVLESF